MRHIQTQNQESKANYQQPYAAITTVYTPNELYNSASCHRILPRMNIQTSHCRNTQPLFDYSTPREPLFRFQTHSISQFRQPYCPQFTQPQRPNYHNMDTKLN
jgi:hypothetical protein